MVLPITFSSLILTPAKVNLGLKIVRRREDNYHDIFTVMEPISLADTIYCEFSLAPEDSFALQSPQMMDLDADANLVVKAARKMVDIAQEQDLAQSGHWNFWLEKRIPSGAGLGGGSSDAAGVLCLLKDFYKLRITRDELIDIAAGLGADIPFFLKPKLALVEGIGDKITPLLQTQERYYLLVKPPFSIATGWAYSSLNATSEIRSVNYDVEQFTGKNRKVSYLLENDFEGPVLAANPLLAEIKEWLACSLGSLGALMSGSGSVVYAIYSDMEALVQAEASARKRWESAGCEFFMARNLNLFCGEC